MFSLVFYVPFEVKADVIEDFETLRIEPGEFHNVSLYLAQDEFLYCRFRIIDGNGIYFFIVDQEGQDAIINGSTPATKYKEKTYRAEDDQLNLVYFHVPHDSTWYVWFSKLSGVPYADSAVSIEGRIGRDFENPVIIDVNFPDGPWSGYIYVSFRIRDDGGLISKVELHANGTCVAVEYDYSETHDISGVEVEGVIRWDTRRRENSIYAVKLVAYDVPGCVCESAEVLRIVNNGILDFETGRLGVAVGIMLLPVISTVVIYRHYKHRVMDRFNKHRTWLEPLIALGIALYLWIFLRLVWFLFWLLFAGPPAIALFE